MTRLALLLALLIASCGGTSRTTPVPARTPLELSLRTSSGGSIELADHRGELVLLAFLGTYDPTSQAVLESISRFARHHEDVLVVAILAQQGAELLVDAYANGAAVTFPIAYAPDAALLEGTTALGRIEAVPAFVALDAEGVPTRRHDGFATERSLEQLVELARRSSPPRDPATVPLIGRPR